MGQAGGSGTPFPIEFQARAWSREVEILSERSRPRLQAERARREIETERRRLRWSKCETEGVDGTSLPGCWKLYVPLDAPGASAAPFGFVFHLTRIRNRPVMRFVAFGQRHPTNPNTKSVYERAHRRLHGRYP